MAVGTRSQGLVADLVDEIRDHHLRQAIGNVLAHGGNADVKQVLQFLPWDGTEIAQGEAWNVYPEVDDSQQHHRDGSADGRSYGSTLDT